jgi:hypothetical protein
MTSVAFAPPLFTASVTVLPGVNATLDRTSTTACGNCRRNTPLSISSSTSACTICPGGNGVPGAPNAFGSAMAFGR